MANRERFHKDFVLDLVSITDYYDSVSLDAANRFRETLDYWLDLVVGSPEAFVPIYKSVRAVRMRGFPYVILYEIHDDIVLFIGIVHGASDHENWFHRIRDRQAYLADEPKLRLVRRLKWIPFRPQLGYPFRYAAKRPAR